MDLKKQIENLQESDRSIEQLMEELSEIGYLKTEDFKKIGKVVWRVQKDLRGAAGTIQAVEKSVKDAQQNLGRIV